MSDKGSKSLGTPIKPVVNAVRILRYLAGNGRAARASQLARDLSINSSTCFNILRTLVAENVLAFDPLSKTYSQGEGLLSLVHANAAENQQIRLIQPILYQLAQKYLVTATLWRRISPERIVLAAIEHSPAKMRIDVPSGQRLPSLIGATGRLVAAGAETEKAAIKHIFGTLRWARPLNFEIFWEQAQFAGRRGWSLDEGYFLHGIISIAAPISDRRGSFSLSLSAVAFAGQHQDHEITALGEEMSAQGRQLSEILYRKATE